MLQNIIASMTGEGGIVRVRALLALGLTAIGGAFLLMELEMPPSEFNILWGSVLAYYFGTRGGS